MIRWSPISALSSHCWIGRSLSSGRPSAQGWDDPLIRKAPSSKPFSSASGKGCSTPRTCAAFCCVIRGTVIDLGFRLVLDASAPYGFDVEQTLPCEFWLREKWRHLDRALLTELLAATVHALQDEIPGMPRHGGYRCQAHLCLGPGE